MDVNARMVTEDGGHRVVVAIEGRAVELPPIEHLLFYGGVGTLVAAGVIEWPVGLALGVGHVLLDLTRRPGLQALGEALEEA